MTAQPLAGEPLPGLETPSSSASKVLALLTALLRRSGGPVSLSEVAIAAGLPKSTTHRLLKVLEDHEFVEREGSLYRLGGSLLDLTESAHSSRFAALRNAAYPQLAHLFERTGAIAVHLGVLRGGSVHYIDKLMRPEGVRLPTRVGGHFPAACTGLGKAMLAVSPGEVLEELLGSPLPRATPRSITAHGQLLAQLRRVAQQGYAVEHEEACHGVVCVAAPILAGGKPVASVSVSVASLALGRSHETRVTDLGRHVAATAAAVGEALRVAGQETAVPATGTVHSLRDRRSVDSAAPSSTTRQEESVVR